MSGWGEEEWGNGPWGGGSATLSVEGAYAISERQVRVVLTAEPLHESAIGVGDALNPLTWSVKRNDTNEELIVIGAAMFGTVVVELYTLTKFQPLLIPHTVSALGLLDATQALISPPTTSLFDGCVKAQSVVIQGGMVDLANIQIDNTLTGGVLQVDSSGDYAKQSGEALLRKLILRRLSTTPGDYFYLDTYGLGLRVKEPLLISDIPKLQAAARLQLLQEPEFAEIDVRITLSTTGILTIHVIGRLRKNNDSMSVSIPVPTNLVQL